MENRIFDRSQVPRKAYILLLLTLLLAIPSLAFIKVDVTLSANGTIESLTNDHQLVNSRNGYVKEYNLKEGSLINAGDTIVIFDTSELDIQIALYDQQILRVDSFLNDLGLLLKGLDSPQTERYRASYALYKETKNRLSRLVEFNQNSFNRTTLLRDQKVLSQDQFERSEFELQESERALAQFEMDAKSNWQEALNSFQDKEQELILSKTQLELQKRNQYSIAPFSGELTNVYQAKRGEYLLETIPLGSISELSGLHITIWLMPKDISFIEEGMSLDLLLESLNYNDWEILKSKVTTISKDTYLNQGQMMYRVNCELKTSNIRSRDGLTTTRLRKGMRLRANFKLAQRRIWQLIRDNMTDYLNPSI